LTADPGRVADALLGPLGLPPAENAARAPCLDLGRRRRLAACNERARDDGTDDRLSPRTARALDKLFRRASPEAVAAVLAANNGSALVGFAGDGADAAAVAAWLRRSW
jgi:uncharacterized protein (DUF2062 family)